MHCHLDTKAHTVHVTRNLRNPRIRRIGNPQFFRGIFEDICGVVKGCPQNHRRVSAESLKGVCGIVEGCLRNRLKGVRGIVKGCLRNRQSAASADLYIEGHQRSQNRLRHPQNRTGSRLVVVERVESS